MGLARFSGPVSGAYQVIQFATQSIGASSGQLGTVQQNIWSWTVPAGMDIVIVDAQVYCGGIGTNSRVNILCGGASILSNSINSATANGVGLTSGANASAGASVQATISNGVFGTASTSIIAPTTPSAPTNTPMIGAYIPGGATVSATMSNGTTATGHVMGTIIFYPVSHPNSVRSAFE